MKTNKKGCGNCSISEYYKEKESKSYFWFKLISILTLIFLISLNIVNGTITNNDFLSYYAFDKTNTFDDKYNLYDGTNTGTLSISNGKNGYGIAVDSTDDVNIGDISQLESTQKFTINGWFYATSSWTTEGLWSFGTAINQQMGIFTSSSTHYIMLSNGANTYGTVSPSLSVNTWYMLTVVYDGTQSTNANKLKYYINGAPQTLSFTGTIPTTTYSAMNSFEIGRFQQQSNSFEGRIDEFMISTKALTDSQITELYNSGTGLFYSFPIPTQTIQTNVKPYYNTSSITINVNTTINTNLTYSLDGGIEISICTNCNNSNFNLNNLSDDFYNIMLISRQTPTSNPTNITRNFTIDTTLPTITNNIPSEINNYQFNGNWFSCSDTNLKSCNISINSQNKASGTNFTLSQNGNLSYTITAIDLANNIRQTTGVLFVNPKNYIYFALSNGTKITSFEIDNVTTNNYYQFNTYDFGLGTHIISFSKIGFLTQDFNFTLTTSSALNLTKTVSPAKIVIKIYDRDKMTLITTNSSITLVATNGVIGSTTTGLFNITNINFINEQYQVIVSNPFYQTEIIYFDFDNIDILEVNVYLLNSSISNLGYVVMSVVADTGELISGAICQALEWKPSLSSYISVAQGLTNTNGQNNLNIELNDKLYKFNCYKNGVSVTTNSQIISVTGTIIPIVLTVSTVKPVNIYQNIIFSLTNTTINNTHQRFIYTYNNQKGLVSDGCLKIYQKQGTKLTLLQQNCTASSTAQIQLVQNLNVTYPIKVIGTIKYNGLELSLVERIIYPEQDITKSLQEYGLDVILPLLFILIGIAFGLLVTPQNIYISIITTIIGVWLSVVIVPSIISSSIAIFVTFICALMLWGGFKPK